MKMTTPATDGINQQQVKPKFTFELVQILRGLAALMVIGYHCHAASDEYFHIFPFKKIFAFGLFGVDFFFVLSGFIITYIHLTDLRRQSRVGSFVRKRFFRIYPIYWVVALITFAYVLLVQNGRVDHVSRVLQWNNPSDWIYMVKSFFLFPQPEIPFVDVSWTLGFEVTFYLVFAICIMMGWKFARIAFFVWIALILAHNTALLHSQNYFLNFILSPLIMEFLMGCLLAYIFREQKIYLTVPLFILFFASLALFAFVYLKLLHHQFGREGWNQLLIVGAAVLALWTCASIDRSRKFAGKKWGLLMLLGNASYSIYLIHTLIIRILFSGANKLLGSSTFENNSLNINLLVIFVATTATIIGILLHLGVEKPLLDFTNRKFVPERAAD